MPYANISELLKALEEEDAKAERQIQAVEADLSRLKSESSQIKSKLEAVRSTNKMLEAGSFKEPTPGICLYDFIADVNRVGRAIAKGVEVVSRIAPASSTPTLEPRPTAEELLEAYNTASPVFTIREVIANLGGRYGDEVTRSTVSNFLRRQEESKQIEVLERGQGRRPSLYRKKLEQPVVSTGGYDPLPPEEAERYANHNGEDEPNE